MWWTKGTLLGLGLFVVGAIVYLVVKLGPIEQHKATSFDLLLFLTIKNLWFWLGLVVAIVIGCTIAKFRS
jgi:hypothetical protein